MKQWQDELEKKFGFRFGLFDRDGLYETRKRLEVGTNPWAVEPRVIASMDFIKRREGSFRELSSTRWDVIIVDEAHHLSAGRSEDDITDRHRLARWLAEATDALLLLTATPHDGYDESFASLLGLLEPTLVPPDGRLRFDQYRRHLVRRLKKHIRNSDDSQKFLQRQVTSIPVALGPEEAALHAAVLSHARELNALAEQTRQRTDAEAIRLVATILRKRAASSRQALAKTLEQRRLNLSEKIEDIEIQREHLRAMRRGESLPDESLARLERDAHRSYLAVMRRLGVQLRRAEDEAKELGELQTLLDRCAQVPESKMTALISHLKTMHHEYPDDKVILFSEYSDTVQAIAGALAQEQGYAGRCCQLTGELSPTQRHHILAEFARPETLLLVATDAAGEGLNLHRHCHRMIHFELPWNPNRLEQRNGRIDRYGQTHTPLISFLYARDSYEGEVLARLVEKIERQISRLGAVGDVLGHIQAERIEELLAHAPTDVQAAIAEAERQIDQELNQAATASIHDLLGDGSQDASEVQKAVEAARNGMQESVDLGDFVCRAVTAAGGRAERIGNTLRISTPQQWVFGSVQSYYERLFPPGMAETLDESPELLVEEDHPLIIAAVRWLRASRFDRQDDHRLAYACTPDITAPDLVATFLVGLRDGTGAESERLDAVRVTQGGTPSTNRAADLHALVTESRGNASGSLLMQLFGSWWQAARESAMIEVRRRARNWRQDTIAVRRFENMQLLEELQRWDQASQRAILGSYMESYRQQTLLGTSPLPPAIRRRLRQHEERVRERREFLERRAQVDEPSIEPLGVLLRVPTSAL
jgi:superfamily II DNA or RNA helicase